MFFGGLCDKGKARTNVETNWSHTSVDVL